jgi:hypothetical protein
VGLNPMRVAANMARPSAQQGIVSSFRFPGNEDPSSKWMARNWLNGAEHGLCDRRSGTRASQGRGFPTSGRGPNPPLHGRKDRNMMLSPLLGRDDLIDAARLPAACGSAIKVTYLISASLLQTLRHAPRRICRKAKPASGRIILLLARA